MLRITVLIRCFMPRFPARIYRCLNQEMTFHFEGPSWFDYLWMPVN